MKSSTIFILICTVALLVFSFFIDTMVIPWVMEGFYRVLPKDATQGGSSLFHHVIPMFLPAVVIGLCVWGCNRDRDVNACAKTFMVLVPVALITTVIPLAFMRFFSSMFMELPESTSAQNSELSLGFFKMMGESTYMEASSFICMAVLMTTAIIYNRKKRKDQINAQEAHENYA